MSAARLIVLITLPVALSACGGVAEIMRYFPEGEPAARAQVWPEPPEVPRYRYAGQLIGEQNFGPSQRTRPSVGKRLLRWITGQAGKPSVSRELVRPQSGVVDGTGRIYVTDVGRPGVYVFDEVEGKLQIWERADRDSAFVSPIGIAVDTQGDVLVADSGLGRIVRLDRQGKPIGSFGHGVVSRPTGLAFNAEAGLLYVADAGSHDIKVFDQQQRLVEVIGHRGVRLAEFNGPTYLAYARGKLYVSDTLNARVQVLTVEGNPLSKVGQRGLYVGNLVRPKGVAVDDEDNIYVVESYYDYLLVFNGEGQLLLPVGGTGAQVDRLFLPAGVWTDSRSRVFVADMMNGRVLILQFLGI